MTVTNVTMLYETPGQPEPIPGSGSGTVKFDDKVIADIESAIKRELPPDAKLLSYQIFAAKDTL